MRLSVFTASLPEWTPAQAVAHLAEQGWDGVEWRVTDQADAEPPGFWAGNRCTWPLATLAADVPAIAATTAGSPLEVSALCGYATCFERDAVETLLAATAALGVPRVRVRAPDLGGSRYPELFEATRTAFARVAERAAAHGVQALLELHHGTVVSSASAALRLLDGVDPAALGVIHDLGNLVIEGGEDTRAGLEMLGPYLAHVQVKNASWRAVATDGDGSVRWEHRWDTLAGGQADARGYLAALADVGYDGWVTLEDFSTAVPMEQRTAQNLSLLRAWLPDAADGR